MFNGDLIFRSSGGAQVATIVLALLALGLLLVAHHWRRSLWSFLALFARIGALGLLTFLLLRPELKKELTSTQEPLLLILKDRSPSMGTQDVEGDDASIITRTEASNRFFDSEQWEQFSASTTMNMQEREFSSESSDTNLSEILKQSQSLKPTTVLLVTDGAWNAGEAPSRVGQEYSLSETTVYSLALGSPKRMPDLEVELIEAPLLVETDDPFALKLELRSSFSERVRSRLVVKQGALLIEDSEVVLEAESKQTIDVIHNFVEEGGHEISVELMPVSGEVLIDNNSLVTKISARAQFMKVLLVDTLPRWEYRFIRNAMIRDERVEVSCLLLHPGMPAGKGPSYISKFPESLADYDVILLGDIGVAPGQLEEDDLEQIITSVRSRATGLILMPGQKGWQQSLLENEDFRALYPVDFNEELRGEKLVHSAKLKLSNAGESSLLMNLASDISDNSRLWESLPGFTWFQPTARLKAGATVLAYHENAQSEQGAMPLIVTSRSGRGKVLYMGVDSSWRWRRGVEDRYHYRFWRQMTRWMSYQRNLTDGTQAQLFLTNDVADEGDEIRLSLQAMTKDGKPAQLDQIKLMMTLPDKSVQLVPLSQGMEWGEYLGRIEADQAGVMEMEVFIEDQSVARREVEIRPALLETVGEPADIETLDELARLTNAESVTYDQREDLLAHLEKAATPPKRYEFLPLVYQWGWIVALIALFLISWIFRRLAGGE